MIKFLLIGDSLTEGYYSYGMKFHSYAEKLEELLCANFPNCNNSDNDQHDNGNNEGMKLPFLIHQHGVSGELTVDMEMRLVEDLQKAESKGKEHLYDFVCILGGTNDLGYEVLPEKVCHNLETMYKNVRKHNSNAILVAITIPEARFIHEPKYIQSRNQINAWILNYGKDDPNVVHVDLEHLLPHFKNEEKTEVDAIHWDDALHMTKIGYDRFGELVFEAIRNLVPKYQNRRGQIPLKCNCNTS